MNDEFRTLLDLLEEVKQQNREIKSAVNTCPPNTQESSETNAELSIHREELIESFKKLHTILYDIKEDIKNSSQEQGLEIQEVYEKLEGTNTPATKNTYVLFDVKRWAEWVVWIALILTLSATIGWAVYLHSSNKTLREQSLKYRVLRMEDKANREVYLQLDSLFSAEDSSDSIRQLRHQVTQYEKALQRQAELLHQQQRLNEEQEELQQHLYQ